MSLRLTQFFLNHRSSGYFLSLIPIVCAIFFYWPDASAWWRFDDPQLIKHALKYSPWQYFFDPHCWQSLTPSNFTPWVILSFDLDLFLADLNPNFFYFHQLSDIVLLSILTFYLLQKRVNPIAALAACFLFLAGAQTAIVSEQLMTRHYLEGLIFSVLAIIFYLKSLDNNKFSLSILGAFFYFLAITAKEIYVPLFVLIFFWPGKTLKQRLRFGLPFIVVFLCYTPWRFYMLGTLYGGYSHLFSILNIGDTTTRILSAFLGNSLYAWLLKAILPLILLYCFWKYREFKVFLFISLVIVVFPLYPVLSLLHEPGRLLFLPWWIISIIVGITLFDLDPRYYKRYIFNVLIFALIIGGSIIHANSSLANLDPLLRRFDTVGKFLWNKRNAEYSAYTPGLADTAWYMSGIMWLKQKEGHDTKGIRMLAQKEQLCHLNNDKIWVFDFQKGRMVLQSKQNFLPKNFCGQLDMKKSLKIRLDYSPENVLSWSMGPYKHGKFFIITTNKWGVSAKNLLPRSGKFKMYSHEPIELYFYYRSPEGWTTYSPTLHFTPKSNEVLVWSR